MDILYNHSLLQFNTFGIEALAREFIEVGTDDELRHLVEHQKTASKQMMFLGGGSNILFTGDYQGTIIKISTSGIEVVDENKDTVLLKVAAGENWDDLVEYCVDKGWCGLENLSGIPGQVGSSPIQNIGAYGSELKDHFESLDGINLCTGERFTYDADHCQFGYRDSIFKRALKGRVVITHVTFRLEKRPLFNLTYQGLKQKFENIPAEEINLKRIREVILETRASKLPDPKMLGNAGSFFKNPMVTGKQMDELKERYPGIAYFPSGESGRFKLAAGWLIEQCGWKGFREGDAGVHKDQALVLVNFGKATGMDILILAGKIQRSVSDKFGIILEREVNVI